MSCSDKSTLTIRRGVSSDGTTTTGAYHVFARILTRQWKKARVSMYLEGSSGLLDATSSVRGANTEDGLAGATVSNIPTSPTQLTADGSAFGASYAALDESKQIVEIGVKAKNVSGSKREMGTVTLIIDLQAEP